jgi:hypothetical protein
LKNILNLPACQIDGQQVRCRPEFPIKQVGE